VSLLYIGTYRDPHTALGADVAPPSPQAFGAPGGAVALDWL